MKRRIFVATLIAIATIAHQAWAGERTVTLAVKNMHCAACPLTVRKSLEAVDGVLKVVVLYDQRTAVVTYDDARADVQALIRATTNAGYPSELSSGS